MALTLTDPLLLLDDLASNNQGNTPRPSATLNLFFQGMRAVKNNHDGKFLDATTALVAASKEAKKEIKKCTDAGATPGKLELEHYAIVLMGLGYVYILKQDTVEAEKHYKRSLHNWVKIHKGQLTIKMVRLMRDVVTILMQNKQWADALNTLKGIASQLQKHKKKKALELGEAVCRMAMVMSEMEEMKENDVRTHFVKATELVGRAKDAEQVAKALETVHREHAKWLQRLKEQGKGDAAKLDAEIAELQAKF